MTTRDAQIAETLSNFFRDFGTSERTVKAAARRMNISESVASSAARAYETASETVYEAHGRNPIRERQIRESAEALTARANAAEAKGLRNASIQELEALTAMTFGQ